MVNRMYSLLFIESFEFYLQSTILILLIIFFFYLCKKEKKRTYLFVVTENKNLISNNFHDFIDHVLKKTSIDMSNSNIGDLVNQMRNSDKIHIIADHYLFNETISLESYQLYQEQYGFNNFLKINLETKEMVMDPNIRYIIVETENGQIKLVTAEAFIENSLVNHSKYFVHFRPS